MKKKIYHLYFLIISVFCVVFTSCKTTNTTVPAGRAVSARLDTNQNLASPVPIEGIPILAWDGVREHTIERYRELKECGIDHNLTMLIAIPNVEVMEQAMNLAKAAGVKMFLLCPELYSDTENIVNRFKDHPALAGYYIVDEAPTEKFQDVGELVRKIQALDDKHLCYVNLGPSWGAEEHCRSHVKAFLKQVPVQLLSYDRYPITIDKNGERSLDGHWWADNKVFLEESKNAGIPWWGFALTTKHTVTWDDPNRIYPIPTLADLRFQVYCNLAYGAQGIQYFTYWDTTLPFGKSPIGSDGKRTDIWYTVQQMSREIKALSNVFLGAEVIKVEHITITAEGKNGNDPVGTTRFDFAKRPLEAKIITKFIPANGTNAVVSFLKNGKRAYMVVINRNLDAGDDISITVTGGTGFQLIKKDGKAVSAFFESSKQTITPGDALIYGWDIK